MAGMGDLVLDLEDFQQERRIGTDPDSQVFLYVHKKLEPMLPFGSHVRISTVK